MLRIFFCLFFIFVKAEAKIFDFKNPSYGAFVGGTYGPSIVNDSAYGNYGGNGVSFDQKEQSNYSGEFGFLVSTQKLNLKLYAEYLFPKHLTAVNAANSAGTSYYNLDTDISAIIPAAAVEYAVQSRNTWRWLVGGGYGYAMATLDNKYSFTSAGGQYYGLNDFEEKATANGSMFLGYTSIEFQFTDIATMMLSAGYRYLKLSTFTSTANVKGFTGNETTGSTLVNQGGSNRTVDLSGPFGGIAFRFYFF